MSIEELVAKYMKEQDNLTTMSFEGQHESLPSTLEVNKEEENLSYNEDITTRDNEKCKKVCLFCASIACQVIQCTERIEIDP